MTMIEVVYRQRTAGVAALVAALERLLATESAWMDLVHDRPEHNRWRRGAPRVRARRRAADRDGRHGHLRARH